MGQKVAHILAEGLGVIACTGRSYMRGKLVSRRRSLWMTLRTRAKLSWPLSLCGPSALAGLHCPDGPRKCTKLQGWLLSNTDAVALSIRLISGGSVMRAGGKEPASPSAVGGFRVAGAPCKAKLEDITSDTQCTPSMSPTLPTHPGTSWHRGPIPALSTDPKAAHASGWGQLMA